MKVRIEVQGVIPSIIRNDEGLYEGNLKSYFRAVFYHASNLTHPYHNFRHICHVAWLCYSACEFYSGVMSKREMRNLLIAALFHDFDHTGRTGSDSVNIKRAIVKLRLHLSEEDADEFQSIADLIRATEYPHILPDDDLTLGQQIIRDADLAQSLNTSWIQHVVIGLASEWNKSPFEVLEMQADFHSRLSFQTAWARKRFPRKVIEEKIAETKELIELLKEPITA